MERIAFILGETFIYWQSIILTLAVITAVSGFLALYLWTSRNGLGAAVAVPLAVVSSVVLGRLTHWYCQSAAYESFAAAMTDYSGGGYALMGVFAGCLLTGLLLKLLRIVKDLPRMLDCMFLGGMAGIAVGRLALLFSASDRGVVLENVNTLPFACPVVNTITGAEEVRLATFMIQAMIAAALAVGFLLFWILKQRRGRKHWDGDTALLGLAFYGTSQIVLDSTRYDSLFLRSNGFVSVVQILGTGCLLTAIIAFSIRMVRSKGWKWYYLLLWLAMLALMGGAGYMEYYVQRHGDQALFAYSVMSGCLAAVLVLLTLTRWLGVRRKAGKYISKSDKI